MHLPAQDCAVYRGCCHPQALWYRRRRRRGCCRLLVVVKNDICCSRCKGQGRLWHIQYTVILVTYTHRRLRSSKEILLDLRPSGLEIARYCRSLQWQMALLIVGYLGPVRYPSSDSAARPPPTRCHRLDGALSMATSRLAA